MFYLFSFAHYSKFIVDLFDYKEAAANRLFKRGFFVVCYFNINDCLLLLLLLSNFLFVKRVLLATMEFDFFCEIYLNYYWNLSINYFKIFSFI